MAKIFSLVSRRPTNTQSRKPNTGTKNITRIQAHNELGSRRSRNIVMIASTMVINRISVTSVVTIEIAFAEQGIPAHPVALLIQGLPVLRNRA